MLFPHRGWSAVALGPEPPPIFLCLPALFLPFSIVFFGKKTVRQTSEPFLSIFSLLRSVLGPGDTEMVKILTRVLRGGRLLNCLVFKHLNAKAARLGQEALGPRFFCFLPVGPPANHTTSLSLRIFSSKPRSVPDDPSQFKGSGISFGLLTSLCPLQVEGWAKCTLSIKLEEQTRGSALNHGEASSATYYLYVFGQNPSLNSFENFLGGGCK